MNLYLILNLFLSISNILSIDDFLAPFYQASVINITDWTLISANLTKTEITCKTSKADIPIFGGALNFNLTTMVSRSCQTKVKNASFYRMKLFMEVYHPEYENYDNTAIIQIMINKQEIAGINLKYIGFSLSGRGGSREWA